MGNGWHTLDESQKEKILNGVVKGSPTNGPWHLELHPTNKCNARCNFCNTKNFRKDEVLPWEILRGVLETKAGGDLNHVRLVGGGEPLIYPQINELLQLLGGINLKGFDIITNGIQLKSHAQAIIENGCDEISISLNEPQAELYEETIGIPAKNFHRALEGIKTAVQARDHQKKINKCKITVKLFLNDKNIGELERFADLVREIGIDNLDIRTAYDTTGTLEGRTKLTSEREEHAFKLIAKEIQKDHDNGKKMVSVSLLEEDNMSLNHYLNKLCDDIHGPDETLPDIDPLRKRDEFCIVPWYTATIGATGKVYACCEFSAYSSMNLGDLHQQSFSDIWDGKRFNDLRKQLRKLILTKGNLEYSQKRHCNILPKCIGRYSCYLTFGLADRTFYEQLAEEFNDQASPLERLMANVENKAIKIVHYLKGKT
jgi:radical SAM protein with 4Fe4S-binding SPASM domain